ncbi:MAG: hypothetical protein V4697_03150 [Patescibacteria group bacterium]
MNKNYLKKISLVTAIFVAAIIFSFGSNAEAATKDLTGWAWSSNIGWIKLHGANGVKVDDQNGNLSGWAWSSNIGWIKFTPTPFYPCPGNSGCQPNVNLSTGAVTGWIRACSATVAKNCDGSLSSSWDGWIKLSGTNHTSPNMAGTGGVTYDTNTGKFKGYAWGSDIVGWVSFNTGDDSVVIPPENNGPSCNISAQVIAGGDSIQNDVRLTWTITNDPGQQYSIARNNMAFGIEPFLSGTDIDTDRTPGPYSYTMTRLNGGGATCTSNTVTVSPPTGGATAALWLGNSRATREVTIEPDDFVNVRWDVSEFFTENPNLVCNTIQPEGPNIPAWLNNPASTQTGTQIVRDLEEDIYTLGMTCTQSGVPAATRNTNNVTIIVDDGELEEI